MSKMTKLKIVTITISALNLLYAQSYKQGQEPTAQLKLIGVTQLAMQVGNEY